MLNALMAISLCWTASPEAASYRLYVSTKPSAYANSYRAIDTSQTLVTVDSLLRGGLYHFQVTALANGLESDPSDELSFLVPSMRIKAPGIIELPRPLNKKNVEYILESATSVTGPWTAETPIETQLSIDSENNVEWVEMRAPAPETTKFYRIRLNVRREGCAP